jgi:hypothetical protein
MPLTRKGAKIMRSMRKTYRGKGGAKKARSVFYASRNAGRIRGVERRRSSGRRRR